MKFVVTDSATSASIADSMRGSIAEMTVIESSNPGGQGYDTGYVFDSPRTKSKVRVMAKAGESREDAIARVRANHNL